MNTNNNAGVPEMVGNQMTKGSCCGGYNQFNEDYAWEMFRQAYPRHQVTSVIPYTITSSEDWDGTSNNGFKVLFGRFTTEGGNTLLFRMIDSAGIPRLIADSSTTDYFYYFPACIVETTDPNVGWVFHGWLVDMLGPLQTPGFTVDLVAMLGGSLPVESPLNNLADSNITMMTPVYSWVAATSVVTLGSNQDGVTFSFDVEKCLLVETYTPTEIYRLMRQTIASFTLVSIEEIADDKMRFVVNISGVTANCQFKWLEHLGVISVIYGVDADNYISDEMDILDATDTLVAHIIIPVTHPGAAEYGYVKGLSLCRASRKVLVQGLNDEGSAQDLVVATAGGSNTLSIPVGAFIENRPIVPDLSSLDINPYLSIAMRAIS